MIVVDVETTGVDTERCSIVSIGAVDYLQPKRRFYRECRIFDGALVADEALAVNGFTREGISDPHKPTDAVIVEELEFWSQQSQARLWAGHNPMLMDVKMIRLAAERNSQPWPFNYRSLDLHSVCLTVMALTGIDRPMTPDGQSTLNLDGILSFVGLAPEPKPHNALRGAIHEAEAFSRLLTGKGMFDEFSSLPVPDHWVALGG
jgi:DNA polymerase III epsilon subunit-like protein